MNEQLFDEDGYPTDLALDNVAKWDDYDDVLGWFKFCQSLWFYPDYFRIDEENKRVFVSTVGWSGNESVIDAMQDNSVFWSTCWVSSHRGGHYEFELK
jgi:hypothetical protein